MPSYKFTYFDGRGVGEPLRWIFVAAKVPFDDNRIQYADWPKLKSEDTWGHMPILEVDGKKLYQSVAIGRYLAKKFNLIPNNEWDAARCDQIVLALMDLRQAWGKFFTETKTVKDMLQGEYSEERCQQEKKVLLETFARVLPKFNDLVKSGGGKFSFGDKLTWADLNLVATLELFEDTTATPDLLAPYQALRDLTEAVKSIPQMKEWLQKRPKTVY